MSHDVRHYVNIHVEMALLQLPSALVKVRPFLLLNFEPSFCANSPTQFEILYMIAWGAFRSIVWYKFH